MSHYEERLAEDVATIRARVAAVASEIERAVADSVRAVLTLDHELASATILGDLAVNREIRGIDRSCHAFVARHLPSAGHLRFVSSVLRLNVGLERIGDYAVAISREAVQMSAPPPETVARDIEMLADQHLRMFKQSMKAFNQANAEMARGAIGLSGQLNTTFERVFADLLQAGEKGKRPIRDLFALLVIFNRLGRVGDQAKNICEETLFTVTGETKRKRVYRIMFVDERNDCASQLAEAHAKKAFPESGRYSSAGWNPANELSPECREYMEQRGYDPAEIRPKRVSTVHEELADHDVIVGLGCNPREHLAEIPFHTVVLQWPIDCPEACGEVIERIKNELANWIRELMETLRGEGAS